MMKKQLSNLLILSLTPFLIFCTSDKSGDGGTMKEEIKLRQYMIQGESLYKNNCSNCHREDGNGLIKLMPPLTSVKYFKENREKLACIVKNGMTGKVEINGVSFDEIMPANPKLTNLQIAEILTYIGNNWGHKFGIVSINEVEQSLKKCANPQQ